MKVLPMPAPNAFPQLLILSLALATGLPAAAQNQAAASRTAPAASGKILNQPRPSAAAHHDAQASGAYDAHRMQSRGSKMALCRQKVAEQGLSGVEGRRALLDCMK